MKLAWDFLPLEGNSFADQRGLQPPQVRIQLEVPPSGYNLDPASIRYAATSTYQGVARQALQAFRQNVGLGVVPFSSQRRAMPDGTIIEYTAINGCEYVVIHVPASAVERLLTGEPSYPCMLVLYNGDRVAAIAMNSLDDPQLAYSARLKKSSWSDTVKTLQTPCGDGTIIVSQIAPTRTRLKGGDYHVFSTSKGDAFKNKISLSGGSTDPLIAACDGNNFHVAGGTFTTNKARVAGSTGNLDGTPYAVNSSGTYYYGMISTSQYLTAGEFLIQSDGELTASQQSDLDSQLDDVYQYDGVNGYTAYGVHDTAVAKIATNDPGAGWVTIDPDASLDVPYQFADSRTMGSKMVHLDATATLIPNTDQDNMEADFLGRHFYSGSSNYYVTVYTVSFPPSLSEEKSYLIDDYENKTYTPYGTLDGADLTGWLHVANGTEILQGFKLNEDKHLYLGNTDYLSTLTEALPKCEEINGLFLDIPLDLIKELA